MTARRWCLLGEYPAFRRNLEHPQEVRELVLALEQTGEEVILLDPALAPGSNWLRINTVHGDANRRVLQWFSDLTPPTFSEARVMRLYVSTDAEDGIPSEEPLYEGHWRPSKDEDSDLPWPEPQPDWDSRAVFLAQLDRVEASAHRIKYRGYSLCRLCGIRNGSEALQHARWRWPAGYRHYLAEHSVQPSEWFEAFITESARALY